MHYTATVLGVVGLAPHVTIDTFSMDREGEEGDFILSQCHFVDEALACLHTYFGRGT